MSDTLNPPDSPPRPPVIPEGLATKLGKFGAPLILVIGALADTADIELDGTSEKTFWASVALIVVTMLGRYLQAAASYRAGTPPTMLEGRVGEGTTLRRGSDDA